MLKSLTIKPIEAQLIHNIATCGEMNPYCIFLIGNKKFQGEVCKKGGKSPIWGDTINIRKAKENLLVIEIRDWHRSKAHMLIGVVKIDLEGFKTEESVTKWFDITSRNETIGQILIEISIENRPTQIKEVKVSNLNKKVLNSSPVQHDAVKVPKAKKLSF